MREGERDKAGMAEVARRVYEELEELRKDQEQLQQETGFSLSDVTSDPEGLRNSIRFAGYIYY